MVASSRNFSLPEAPYPLDTALLPAQRAAAEPAPARGFGGVHGYADFLEIIADPKHPEHHSPQRGAGGRFDSEWLDVELTEKGAYNALRSNRRIRLHQRHPKRQKPPL